MLNGRHKGVHGAIWNPCCLNICRGETCAVAVALRGPACVMVRGPGPVRRNLCVNAC